MSKTWQLRPTAPPTFFEAYPEIEPIILSLLYQRGLTAQQEIDKFLEPDFSAGQYDPFLFLEMAKTVKRIFQAIKKKEKILIYGDYDVDGVCSAVLMSQTLQFLGSPLPAIYLPHRELEGYGLNLKAVEYIKKQKNNLLIAVDCGTNNILELKKLAQAKIEVIILDHHSAAEQRPPVFSFINPKFKKEKYPFKDLAAGGVVFKLTQALLATAGSLAGGEAFIKWSLDIVALATVADMMPLLDENRTLVKWGLVVLNKTKRLGLKELFNIAGLATAVNGDQTNMAVQRSKRQPKPISAYEIGFMIAPRLNAAGRMNHANAAFNLLTAKDQLEAKNLAQELNQANQQRQSLTNQILAQAEQQAIEQIKKDKKVLVAVSPVLLTAIGQQPMSQTSQFVSAETPAVLRPNRPEKNTLPINLSNSLKWKLSEGKYWPVSLIGLAAGKISDKYHRPCFLITKTVGGYFSGSGRSIKKFNIIEAVSHCQDILNKFGGHPGACGFTLQKEQDILTFTEKINNIADQILSAQDLKSKIIIDVELKLADLTYEFLRHLQKLEPFGQDNPEPLFVSRNLKIIDLKYAGQEQKHLILQLTQNNIIKRAVGFFLSPAFGHLKIGDFIDIIYKVKENSYNGVSELQIVIEDIQS